MFFGPTFLSQEALERGYHVGVKRGWQKGTRTFRFFSMAQSSDALVIYGCLVQ